MTGRRAFLILAIFIFGLSAQAVAASYPLIVQVPSGANITTIAAMLHGTLVESIPSADTYLLNVPVLPSPATVAELGIQWMELNKSVTLPRFAQRGVLQVSGTAAADWYKDQPWMRLIKARDALARSTGTGVVVADINSQVDYAHPALVGHLTSGSDFIAGRPSGAPAMDQFDAGFLDQFDAGFLDQFDAGFLDQFDAGFLDQSDPNFLDGLNPAYSHGTVSAGIIAAIAPGSMVMPLRAFDDDGHSDYFALARAIRFAVEHGAQIINLSFGTLTPSQAIERAVQFAQVSNVLLVAAAGNSGTAQPEYPAAYAGVLNAAATDLSDTKASFSNFGSRVFVAAPGVDIISAYPLGYYSMVSGTSVSAAALAGTVALVRSIRTTDVRESISRGAVNIDGKNPNYASQLGYGRIDVLAATVAPGTPSITTVSPNTGEQGRTLAISVIARDTHFDQGSTQLSLGAGVMVTNVVVASPTSLTAQVSIAPGAAPGARSMTATTSTEVVTLDNAFSVVPGVASLTSIGPNSARQGDSLTVSIGGQLSNFVQGTTQVSLGQGITVDAVSVSGPTSLSAQVSVSPAAAIGPRNVSVTTGAEVLTLNNGFTVTLRPPVITAVTPDSAQQGQSVTLAVTSEFTHFVQGTTQVGLDGIAVTSIAVSSGTSLSAQLTIPASAALGSRTLTIMTGSEVVTYSNALTVTPGAPVITGLSPNTGKQGDSIAVAVTGLYTHFVAGTTQVGFDGGITVTSVATSSGTSLTAQLTIPPGAALGSRTLTVTSGSEVVTLANAFTVMPGAPAITAVNPNTGKQGDTVTVEVTGQFTHFVQDTTQVDFGNAVTVTALSVNSATSLTAHLGISTDALAGSRSVTVTTDTEVITLNNGFSVTPGTPVLTTITPNNGKQGETRAVTITAQYTSFSQGATQVDFGTGITGVAVTVAGATSLTAEVTIDAAAALGTRSVRVTTNSEVVTLNNVFTVNPGTPVITAVSPNTGQQGQSLVVTVAGQFTGFVQGDTQISFGPDITVTSATVTSPTSLTAQLEIAGTAAVGSRALTVMTGSEVVTRNNGFTVTPIPPVITSVLPNSGRQGQTVTVAVTGEFTHFAQGATQVSLDGGITAAGIAVSSGTSLIAQLTIPQAAALGSRTLTVTTGSEVATLSNVFNVMPGTPAILVVSPNTGKRGDAVTVAIMGEFTHFAQDTTAVGVDGGITVTSVAVSSGTSLAAQLAIPADAALGSRTLTVTTGSEVVTLNNAFSVTAGAPVITSVSPNAGQQGQAVAVTVTGQFTGFVEGSTQVSFGAGLMVVNVAVSSPTSLTAQLEVGGTAAIGSRSLTITTGTEAVTLNNGFTVTARPAVLTTALPGSGQQGQTVTLAVTGEFTHFAQGSTQVSLEGITVGSVTVTGATALTAQLTIPAAAGLGPRSVTVTTGTEVATLNNAFSVTAGTPVMTGVSPNAGQQGQTLAVTVTGQFTRFAEGSTQVNFGPDVTVVSVAVTSPTSLTAQLEVGGTAAIGSRWLTITTGTEIVTLSNGFMVTARPAVLTTAMPGSGQQGQTVTLSVTGEFTHFAQGMTQVALEGITVNSVTVTGASSLIAQLTVPSGAALGSRSLTVATGSEVATLNNAFNVTAGTPVITTANPSAGRQGDTITVTIAGQFTHFIQGATLVDFGPGLTVVGLTVNSATNLIAQLAISSIAAPGPHRVTVTTAEEAVAVNNAFNVIAGTPVIMSVSSNMGAQGTTVAVTLTGQFTHFAQGMTQADFGPGVAVTALTVNSPTSLTAVLEISEDAPPGFRQVRVTTAAETIIVNNGFQVTPVVPLIPLIP